MAANYIFRGRAFDASQEQISRVLPYLAGRDAFRPSYVKLRIQAAFRAVNSARQAKVFSGKVLRDRMREVARALQVIEEAKNDWLLDSVALSKISTEEIRQCRREVELWTHIAVGRDGNRRNVAREVAVRVAHELLTDLGDGRPLGCTLEGPWRRVSDILYGDDGNLFSTVKKLHKIISTEKILSGDRHL